MNEFAALLTKYKPGILIGLGLGSMVLSTVASWRYAPEAKEAIREREEELQVDKLPMGEAVKTVLPYAIPPVLFAGIGVCCIVAGNQINVQRGAAAMMAYTLSQETLRDYREKTRELVGDKKERSIKEAVANDLLERNNPKNSTVIITDNGDRLCFDNIINQYFKSSKTRVETAINKLNFDIINGRSIVTLNDYCLTLGLPEVELGTELGWGLSNPINVTFGSKLLDNGDPCVSIFHNNIPKPINLI